MLKFLQQTWTDTGNYLVAHPSNGGYAQSSFADIETAYKEALKYSEEGKDSYFAVGSVDNLGKPAKRKTENILQFKSFFIDIDCGEDKFTDGKGYLNQSVALEALKVFIKKVNLPKPILVNSGYGYHVYWTLTEPVASADWLPIAQKFKQVVAHAKLIADSTRTSDRASILRVPGTINYKRESQALVKVEKWSEPCTLAEFVEPLDAYMAANDVVVEEAVARVKYDPKAIEILEQHGIIVEDYYPEGDFEYILDNCAAMKYAVEHNESLVYPQWCAALSIANACSEPEECIRRVSENHEDYNQSFAVHKASEFTPHTCANFRSNFKQCEGCERRQGSPISLRPAAPQVINNTEISASVTICPGLGVAPVKPVQVDEPKNGKIIPENVYHIDGFEIAYPIQYTLNSHGISTVIGEDKTIPITFCQYPIRFIERISDFALCEDIAYFKIKFPKDGWRDFKIKLRDISDSKGAKVCSELAGQGCIIGSKEQKYMGEFMSAFLQHIINKAAASKSHAQLGWTEDGEFFVLQDKCIKKDGTVVDSEMSSDIVSFTRGFRKKGTLEEWLKIINTYTQSGYEPYAFGHSIAYGSLLFRFTGFHGAIVSLLGDTGSGKSTVLQTINSVFGHPEDLMLQQDDTVNARMKQIAAMNSICPTYDEASNIEPEELSDFCYAISQGRDKRRLTQTGAMSGSELRWCSIAATSVNHSLYERLGMLKSDASAEAMRVFEYHVRSSNHKLSKSEAQNIFEPLRDNYGHAGEIFVAWLMQNQDYAKDRVKYWRDRYDVEANVPNKERYWAAIIGSTLAGAELSAKLGLNTFNVENMYAFALEQGITARGSVSENRRSALSLLVDFMNSQIRSTIVMGGGTGANGKDNAMWAKQEPTNGLVCRVEIDKNIGYISRSAIRKWVTEGGGDYNGMRAELMKKKVIINENINKVLSIGSQTVKSGQLPCWMVDLNHREMSGDVQLQVVKMKDGEKDEKVLASGKPF